MHQGTAKLMPFFRHDHLPAHLQVISKPFAALATKVALNPDLSGAEVTVAVRNILIAKDAAVRAGLKPDDVGAGNNPPGAILCPMCRKPLHFGHDDAAKKNSIEHLACLGDSVEIYSDGTARATS